LVKQVFEKYQFAEILLRPHKTNRWVGFSFECGEEGTRIYSRDIEIEGLVLEGNKHTRQDLVIHELNERIKYYENLLDENKIPYV
jgi:hypothetical protein